MIILHTYLSIKFYTDNILIRNNRQHWPISDPSQMGTIISIYLKIYIIFSCFSLYKPHKILIGYIKFYMITTNV